MEVRMIKDKKAGMLELKVNNFLNKCKRLGYEVINVNYAVDGAGIHQAMVTYKKNKK